MSLKLLAQPFLALAFLAPLLLAHPAAAEGEPSDPINGCRGCSMMGGMRGPSAFDSNGDGEISLGEFEAGHQKIFEKWDTDGDGVLKGEELQPPGGMRCGCRPESPPAEGGQ